MNNVKIRIAGNTQTPCMQAIKAKGFRLTMSTQHTKNDDYLYDYCAEKESLFFSATTPEELLGLIAMWEVRGDNWRATKKEVDEFTAFFQNAPMYDDDGNEIKE